jgi:hypothetical protein
MAIIQFNKADILKSKNFEPTFYTFRVAKAPSAGRASSSQKTLNFDFDFVVTTPGPFHGKEHRVVFNTGMEQGSVLGNLQYEPFTRLMDLEAAVTGKPKRTDPGELDTDVFVGKEFDGKIAIDVVDGNPVPKITVFVPKGKGGEAQPY